MFERYACGTNGNPEDGGLYPKPCPACVPGESDCASTSTLKVCDVTGQWQPKPCPGCKLGVAGPVCPGAAPLMTLVGQIDYERRDPDLNAMAWSASTTLAPLAGATIQSFYFDSNLQNLIPFGSAVTGKDGKYAIDFPSDGSEVHKLRIVLARNQTNPPWKMQFAVVNPDVPDGLWQTAVPVPGKAAAPWSWTSSVPPGPKFDFTITDIGGSGGASVYDGAWRAYDRLVTGLQLTSAPSLAIWFRKNVTWSCPHGGSCYAAGPVGIDASAPQTFGQQMYASGDATEQNYWSAAMHAFLIGRWGMAFAAPPIQEDGPYCLGTPVFAGRALGDGWPLWFSAAVRDSPVLAGYWQGSFFWFDLASRTSAGLPAWTRPSAADTSQLWQHIDPAEVAAMLWTITNKSGSVLDNPANAPFMKALTRPEMAGPSYGRNYVMKKWQQGTGCGYAAIMDAGMPAPCFADYLDALRCGGMGASQVDAATDPATHYPYPSGSPLCGGI